LVDLLKLTFTVAVVTANCTATSGTSSAVLVSELTSININLTFGSASATGQFVCWLSVTPSPMLPAWNETAVGTTSTNITLWNGCWEEVPEAFLFRTAAYWQAQPASNLETELQFYHTDWRPVTPSLNDSVQFYSELHFRLFNAGTATAAVACVLDCNMGVAFPCEIASNPQLEPNQLTGFIVPLRYFDSSAPVTCKLNITLVLQPCWTTLGKQISITTQLVMPSRNCSDVTGEPLLFLPTVMSNTPRSHPLLVTVNDWSECAGKQCAAVQTTLSNAGNASGTFLAHFQCYSDTIETAKNLQYCQLAASESCTLQYET